jgi:hypothetical protein
MGAAYFTKAARGDDTKRSNGGDFVELEAPEQSGALQVHGAAGARRGGAAREGG